MNKAFSEHSKMKEQQTAFKVFSEPLTPAKDSEQSNPCSPEELPAFYGTNTIFLTAQDPHQLFTYWDIDTLHHPERSTFLRCIQANGPIESEIEVPFETRNLYLPVSQAGGSYFVELGYYQENQWNCISQSATVQTPIHQLSSSLSFDYAIAPSALNFQELLQHFQNIIRSNEILIRALTRLQKEGRLLQLPASHMADLSEDEKIILDSLLGKDFLISCSPSSLSAKQLQEKIEEHLEKKLCSLNAIETLAPPEEKNAKVSLLSTLTNFLNNIPLPWNTEMLSHGTAETLSHSQASDTSSWAHPVSEENTEEQDFFLNVHAEVHFYGSTRPGSSVTIDDKPVPINPDGSFYYHFSFPDEAYEAPIVSQSPDGLEKHAAVLRFHRAPSSKSATSGSSPSSAKNEHP